MIKDKPIGYKEWVKNNNPDYLEKKYVEKHNLIFKNIFDNNISGNVVQFGGGSYSGI